MERTVTGECELPPLPPLPLLPLQPARATQRASATADVGSCRALTPPFFPERTGGAGQGARGAGARRCAPVAPVEAGDIAIAATIG